MWREKDVRCFARPLRLFLEVFVSFLGSRPCWRLKKIDEIVSVCCCVVCFFFFLKKRVLYFFLFGSVSGSRSLTLSLVSIFFFVCFWQKKEVDFFSWDYKRAFMCLSYVCVMLLCGDDSNVQLGNRLFFWISLLRGLRGNLGAPNSYSVFLPYSSRSPPPQDKISFYGPLTSNLRRLSSFKVDDVSCNRHSIICLCNVGKRRPFQESVEIGH